MMIMTSSAEEEDGSESSDTRSVGQPAGVKKEVG